MVRWEVAERLETMVRGVPESLRNLVEQQLEQLSSVDQALLEAASVAGAEFSAIALAVTVDDKEEAVEARCDALARRGQFLRALGVMSWPDGTITARYAFVHALFQETLYERVPISRRLRWHRQMVSRLEVGYGPEARESVAGPGSLASHVQNFPEWPATPPRLRPTADRSGKSQ